MPFIPNENLLRRSLHRIPAPEVSEEDIPSESTVDAAGMIPGHFQGEEGIEVVDIPGEANGDVPAMIPEKSAKCQSSTRRQTC